MSTPAEDWPDRELTAREQFRYLFGDPRIRKDNGLLGRMAESIGQLERKVDRLLRLGWALLTAVLVAVLTLVANLMVQATGHH